MSTCVISNGLEDVRVTARSIQSVIAAAIEWFPGEFVSITPSVPLVSEPVREPEAKAWVVES